MKEDSFSIEIYDSNINSEDINRLFEEILNQKIPKDTEIIIEVIN